MSKVLVVDDDESIVSMLSRVLKGAGHEVHTASDGLAAIDKVFSNRDFSAVLMDVVMPRMGGPDALRAISRLLPRANYIVISGMATEEEVRDDIDRNIRYQFIPKPFDSAQIVEFVEKPSASN